MNIPGNLLAAAALAACLAAGSVGAATQDRCDLRLAVQLTPDVPDPRAPGFLGSLLADPIFQLTWVRNIDSGIVVELTGPGPTYRCQRALKQLKLNTHVLNVTVVQPRAGS